MPLHFVAVYAELCADRITDCDGMTSYCSGCFCYIQPSSVVIYGTKIVGSHGQCIWSNCECVKFKS